MFEPVDDFVKNGEAEQGRNTKQQECKHGVSLFISC